MVNGPHRTSRVTWFLVGLAVAPVVALILVALLKVGHGYLGVSDNGMNELRIRDIGAQWPLIGPFSRDGWSHPGPALLYVLVLPFRLTGNHSNGLLVGAALINATAVGAIVVLAHRRGGTVLAVPITLGLLILLGALGPEFVWDPWNPFVTVLPFGVALLGAWCVTCGDAWCLPVVAGVGSFCVQTHVGYAPFVAVLLAISILALSASVPRPARRGAATGPSRRGPVLITIAVLVVLWLPPIVQQVTGTPGNLDAIVHYFRSDQATHSLREGHDVVTAQFAWNPDWLVGGKPVNVFSGEVAGLFTGSFPIWWIALVAAWVIAWRTGARAARNLGTLLLITIATAIVSVARTIGPLLEYRLRFIWVLGMFTAAFVAWVAWDRITRHGWFPTRVVAIAAFGAAVALSAIQVAGTPDAATPNAAQGRIAATLASQLVDRLPRGPGAVVITVKNFGAGPLITGLMVELERHHIRVALRDNLDDRLRFGTTRMLGHEPVRSEIRVVVDREIERVAARPCTREIAYWGQASRRERARAQAAIARITRDVAHGRIGPRRALHRIAAYSPDLVAAAVFLLPQGRLKCDASPTGRIP